MCFNRVKLDTRKLFYDPLRGDFIRAIEEVIKSHAVKSFEFVPGHHGKDTVLTVELVCVDPYPDMIS